MEKVGVMGLIVAIMLVSLLMAGCMAIASSECSSICKEQGHLKGKCRKYIDPVPDLCSEEEINIGPQASCNYDENMIGARATCCCIPKPVIENKTAD